MPAPETRSRATNGHRMRLSPVPKSPGMRRGGNRSKQASEKPGYTNIIEIGGINSWPGETVNGDK